MRDFKYLGLLALPPLCVFAVQAVLNRLFSGKNPQALAVISMLGGGPLFFALLSRMELGIERNAAWHAYMPLFYAFGAYTYFHVFNMSETSRRIRLLFAAASRRMGEDSAPENVYDERLMIRARLDRLKALRQIREENGRVFSRGALLPAAAVALRGLSRLFGRPWPRTSASSFAVAKEPNRVM